MSHHQHGIPAACSRTLHRVSEFFFSLSTLCVMPLFVVVITVDVTLRYFFHAPLPWGMELTGILLLVLFFSSVTKCEEENRNIQMELFYSTFCGRRKVAVDMLGKAAGALLFAVLAWQSFRMVPEMYLANETGVDFRWPLWPYRLFMASLSLLCLGRLMLDCLARARRLITGREHE